MGEEPQVSEDGLLGKARRLADDALTYARSDEAKAKLAAAKKKAVEVRGAASAGAKDVLDKTGRAAARAKGKIEEIANSERAGQIRSGAVGLWDRSRSISVRGVPWMESSYVVAVVLILFFPLGLWLLWRQSGWSTTKKTAWTATWAGLLVIGLISSWSGRTTSEVGISGEMRPTSVNYRDFKDQPGRSSSFFVVTQPVKVLPVDRNWRSGWVQDLDFSPDGKYLITQDRLWTTPGWRQCRLGDQFKIDKGLFSPDGSMYSSIWDTDLLIWRVNGESAEVVETFRIAARWSDKTGKAPSFPYVECDAIWTPYGVAMSDMKPKPKDSSFPFLRAGSRRSSFEPRGANEELGNASFAFSERGRMMGRIFDGDGTLASNGVLGYEDLPHGRRVVEVWAWPGGGGKPVFRTKVAGRHEIASSNQIAFLADGKTFLLTYTEPYTEKTNWKDIRHVVFYDTTTWRETNRFKSQDSNFQIAAVSHDGKLVATTSGSTDDYTVTLWSPASQNPVRVFKSLYAEQVIFSNDGKTLVTAVGGSFYKDKTYHINFFDVETGRCVGRIKDKLICSIALSPDGRYLVSGHCDSVAKVWDLSSKTAAPFEDEYEAYNARIAGEKAENEGLRQPAPPISKATYDSLPIGMNYVEALKLIGGNRSRPGWQD